MNSIDPVSSSPTAEIPLLHLPCHDMSYWTEIIQPALLRCLERLENPKDDAEAMEAFRDVLVTVGEWRPDATGRGPPAVAELPIHDDRESVDISSKYFYAKILPFLLRVLLATPSLFPHPIPMLIRHYSDNTKDAFPDPSPSSVPSSSSSLNLYRYSSSTFPSSQQHSLSLSPRQVLGLLAHTFFCMFRSVLDHTASAPSYHPSSSSSSFPPHHIGRTYLHCNMDRLLDSAPPQVAHRTFICVLIYFYQMEQFDPHHGSHSLTSVPSLPSRVTHPSIDRFITISRRCLSPSSRRQHRHWHQVFSHAHHIPVLPLFAVPNTVPIQSPPQVSLYADFANARIGGGVLEGLAAQEENMFAANPECMTAMVLMGPEAMMGDAEAMVITGTVMFSYIQGLRPVEPCRIDAMETRSSIVCVDASPCWGKGALQFRADYYLRDLMKLVAGLDGWNNTSDNNNNNNNDVVYATGHWGCGMFGGDQDLKALQQILAASWCRVRLRYHCLRDRRWGDRLRRIDAGMQEQGMSVAELFQVVEDGCADETRTLFECVEERLGIL